MKKLNFALSCCVLLGIGGCTKEFNPGSFLGQTTIQESFVDNYVVADFGFTGGKTISIALPTTRTAERDTQVLTHHWVADDVYQYDVILSKDGENIKTVTVFPQKGESGAKFIRLQAGFIYKVAVIAKGNAGGTAPELTMNAQNPAVGIFDFTDGSESVSKTINLKVIFDNDDKTGIINIIPVEGGSNEAVDGNAVLTPLTLNPRSAEFTPSQSISNSPNGGLVMDNSQNLILCDWGGNNILKITPDGVVTTFAGYPDGLCSGWENFSKGFDYVEGVGTNARFNRPAGMVKDAEGNLFVCDSGNKCIRKITPDGTVSTFYGGKAGYSTAYQPSCPHGLAMDKQGNFYITDNNRICKVTSAKVGSVIAGQTNSGYLDGEKDVALFAGPQDLLVDDQGNIIISDTQNNCIRKLTPDGQVSTLAGNKTSGNVDGNTATARFYYPVSLCRDGMGYIYVEDAYNYVTRRISPDGVVETLVTPNVGVGRMMFAENTMYLATGWQMHKLFFE